MYDIVVQGGASPRRADARLGSARAPYWPRMGMRIEAVSATVLPRGTSKMNNV